MPGGGAIRSEAEAVADQSGAAGLELIEVAGRIKWFDVAKGFGFIVPEGGVPDVLLHVTVAQGRFSVGPGRHADGLRSGDAGQGSASLPYHFDG